MLQNFAGAQNSCPLVGKEERAKINEIKSFKHLSLEDGILISSHIMLYTSMKYYVAFEMRKPFMY